MSNIQQEQRKLLDSSMEFVKRLAAHSVSKDALCHADIVPMEECVRCKQILEARKLLEQYNKFIAGERT